MPHRDRNISGCHSGAGLGRYVGIAAHGPFQSRILAKAGPDEIVAAQYVTRNKKNTCDMMQISHIPQNLFNPTTGCSAIADQKIE
jgi:hypothetical protein